MNRTTKIKPISRKPSPSRITKSIPSQSVTIIPISANDVSLDLVKPDSPKLLSEVLDQKKETKLIVEKVKDYELGDELLGLGYESLNRIIARDSTGKLRTDYIKAVNTDGLIVYIDIDDRDYNVESFKDEMFVKRDRSSLVPHSFKTGAYNLATEVSGVVFECNKNGLCVFSRRGGNIEPTESAYIVSDQYVTVETTDQSIITYPVVRLSEIRVNPKLVLELTQEVVARLRNSELMQGWQGLKRLKSAISQLEQSYDNYYKLILESSTKLGSVIDQLTEWNNIYKANPPSTPEGKDKYQMLLYNLEKRNKDVELLLTSMNKVGQTITKVQEASSVIDEVVKFTNSKLGNWDIVATK